MSPADHDGRARSRRWSREKRAAGYKYDAEERVLARFAAFCRSEFPGLEAPTRASVEAWITAARRRGVTPATLQSLAAPVQGAGPLARPPRHRRPTSCPPGRCPARPLRPAHLHRRGTGGPVRPDRPLPLRLQVPFRHLVMPVLFRTIYACGLRVSEARLLRFGDVDVEAGVLTIREGKGGKDRQVPRQRAAARTARWLPRPGGRAHRRGLVLPRHGRAPADARATSTRTSAGSCGRPAFPTAGGATAPASTICAIRCGQ